VRGFVTSLPASSRVGGRALTPHSTARRSWANVAVRRALAEPLSAFVADLSCLVCEVPVVKVANRQRSAFRWYPLETLGDVCFGLDQIPDSQRVPVGVGFQPPRLYVQPVAARKAPEATSGQARSFVAVVGHGPTLEREDGASTALRQLGAIVRTLDLWDDPIGLIGDDDAELKIRPRAVVFEALDRPDLAVAALRAVRKESYFDRVGTLITVTVGQIARIDPSSGFDDFCLHPYLPEELYGRIRALEWRRSEFATEERHKVGGMVVDTAAREVHVDGRPISLTAKEFGLLAYLCERRGRMLSREQLLSRVWGNRYEGGPRTVDIHVRRLRAKLGQALPLETLRGAGYKLRAPEAESRADHADGEPG
jgi:DNA-binding winged helix-turn-helix (wHTH) protein